MSAAPWRSARADQRNSGTSAATGPERAVLGWSFAPGPGTPSDLFGGPAVVDGEGRLFCATRTGLVALSASGELLWSLDEGTRAAVPALDPAGNVVTALPDGVRIVTPVGEPVRRFGGPLGSPRAVQVTPDGAIYVSAWKHLHAFGPEGALRWSVALPGTPDWPAAVSPGGDVYLAAAHDDAATEEGTERCRDWLVAIAAGSGSVATLREAEGPCYEEAGWGRYGLVTGGPAAALCLTDGTSVAGIGGSVAIGARAVRLRGGGPLVAAPDGTLFVTSHNQLIALGRDGRERWRGSAREGWISHAVRDSAGRIYVADAGEVHAFDGTGRVLWSCPVPGVYPYARQAIALSVGAATLCVTTCAAVHVIG